MKILLPAFVRAFTASVADGSGTWKAAIGRPAVEMKLTSESAGREMTSKGSN